ncbi:MAG: hypothetical protein ACOVJ5_00085 [Gloeomargaritales cyanobacterium]
MNAQKKVVILDSLQSSKIITELIQKDFLKLEVKTLIKMDSLSRQRIVILKKSNEELLSAYNQKNLQINNLNLVIENNVKTIAKEKSKNKFLKVVSLLSLGITGILLITR